MIAHTPGANDRLKLVLLMSLVLGGGCESEIKTPSALRGKGQTTVLAQGAPNGQTGWWPDVEFSTADVPHIAFCDAERGDLMYAARTNDQWHVETVSATGAVGKYLSLALDRNDHPAISFYDQSKKYLRYAWRESRRWTTERIAWGPEIGHASQLHFAQDGLPHLFYYVPSGRLVHNRRLAASQWHAVTVAEAAGGFSSRIGVQERADGFWLSFVDWNFRDTALLLATPHPQEGHTLHRVSGQKGPGWRSFIASPVDSPPAVIYSESNTGHLKLAVAAPKQPTTQGSRAPTHWNTRILLRHVGNFSGSLLPSGGWVIAYEDIFEKRLGQGVVKMLRFEHGVYSKFQIDNEIGTGEYLDIAVNSKGAALVAYYADSIKGLRLYDETTNKRETLRGANSRSAVNAKNDKNQTERKSEIGREDQENAP